MKWLGCWTTSRGGSNKQKQEGITQVPTYLLFVFKIPSQKLAKHKRPRKLLGGLALRMSNSQMELT